MLSHVCCVTILFFYPLKHNTLPCSFTWKALLLTIWRTLFGNLRVYHIRLTNNRCLLLAAYISDIFPTVSTADVAVIVNVSIVVTIINFILIFVDVVVHDVTSEVLTSLVKKLLTFILGKRNFYWLKFFSLSFSSSYSSPSFFIFGYFCIYSCSCFSYSSRPQYRNCHRHHYHQHYQRRHRHRCLLCLVFFNYHY